MLKEGNATKPKATDIVAVQYEGKLLDGKVFDSTAQHGGQPAVFIDQADSRLDWRLTVDGWRGKIPFLHSIKSSLWWGKVHHKAVSSQTACLSLRCCDLKLINPPAEVTRFNHQPKTFRHNYNSRLKPHSNNRLLSLRNKRSNIKKDALWHIVYYGLRLVPCLPVAQWPPRNLLSLALLTRAMCQLPPSPPRTTR